MGLEAKKLHRPLPDGSLMIKFRQPLGFDSNGNAFGKASRRLRYSFRKKFENQSGACDFRNRTLNRSSALDEAVYGTCRFGANYCPDLWGEVRAKPSAALIRQEAQICRQRLNVTADDRTSVCRYNRRRYADAPPKPSGHSAE